MIKGKGNISRTKPGADVHYKNGWVMSLQTFHDVIEKNVVVGSTEESQMRRDYLSFCAY